MNKVFIKRILIEKTLEVLDALILKDPKDYYQWYAAFSIYLAKDYPTLFKKEEKLRASLNGDSHYEFAKSFPFEYRVFNSFL